MEERGTTAERLGRFLRQRRESYGWKIGAVARRAAFSGGYLSKLERGDVPRPDTMPSREALEKLARGYQTTVEELEKVITGGRPRLAPTRPPEDYLEQARMVMPIAIPVVEHPAHAGHHGTPVLDYVYVERPFGLERNLICVAVVGECMAPRVNDGDRVIVDRDLWPEPGDLAIVVVDEEVYLRRVYRQNGHLLLRCDNPAYPDLTTDEAEVVGKVVEIRKRP